MLDLIPVPRTDTNVLNVVGTGSTGLQCALQVNAAPNNINFHGATRHWFTSIDRVGPTNITLEVDTSVTVNKTLTIGNNTQSIAIGGLNIGNNGYACKAGGGGEVSAHSFSIDWVNSNTPNLWIDDVNVGKLWVGDHPEIIKETVVSCWAVRTLGNLASHFTAGVQVDGKLTSTTLVIGGDLISAGISIGDSPYKNVYRADTHTFGSVSGVGDTAIKFGGSKVTIGDNSNKITIGGCTLFNNKISCDAISIADGAILSLGVNARITLGTNSNIDFGLDLSDTTTIRRGLSAGIRTAYSRTITASSSVMALRTKEPRHINFAWETVESEGNRKVLAFYIDGQRQGVIPFTPGDPYP